MRSAREFGNALVAAILSVGLTLGALSISLVGFIPEEAEPPTLTPIPSPIPITATFTLPPSPTLSQGADTPTPTATNTLVQSTLCPPPAGWTVYIVQAADSLESISAKYGVTSDYLKSKNCLISNDLIPGKSIYVPNLPTSTSAACVPGSPGWVNYVVKSGDTFFGIAYRFYTTEREIKRVNCRSKDDLFAGEIILVPNVTPRPLTNTPISVFITDASTATPVFTEPGTMLPFTLTPSQTQPPAPTFTVSPIPTQTASLTPFPEATSTP